MPTTIDLTSELRATMRGTVLAADDEGYDAARAKRVARAVIASHAADYQSMGRGPGRGLKPAPERR